MMTRKGTADFIFQRASAVILLPFVVWVIYSAVALADARFEEVRHWAARPLNAIPFALFIIVSALHMRIGMAEVITDYIHSGMKGVLQSLNWLAALALAAAATVAAYALAF